MLKIYVDNKKYPYLKEICAKKQITVSKGEAGCLVIEKINKRVINTLADFLSENAFYYYVSKILNEEMAYVLCLHGGIYLEEEYMGKAKKALELFIANGNENLHLDSFIVFNLRDMKKDVETHKDILNLVFVDIKETIYNLMDEAPVLKDFTLTIDLTKDENNKTLFLFDQNKNVINEEYLKEELFLDVNISNISSSLAYILSIITILTLELPIPINIKLGENLSEKEKEGLTNQIKNMYNYYGFSYLNIV